MAGPWTYKAKRRGGNRGEQIALSFQGDEMFTSRWYPPWQNELMQDNAGCIVNDLNAAFTARKAAMGEACEHGVDDGEYCEECSTEMKRARKEDGLEEETESQEARRIRSI